MVHQVQAGPGHQAKEDGVLAVTKEDIGVGRDVPELASCDEEVILDLASWIHGIGI